MLYTSVALSILISLTLFECFSIFAGGFISAGYIAFFLDQPFRIISTLIIATASYGIVELLNRRLILFGRRRFFLLISLSILLSFIFEKSFIFVSHLNQDIRIIGYLIPGLIANDMSKQGIIKTVLILLLSSTIIWMIMHLF